MPMLNHTTELEAVNEMLMSIGQAPVSTLQVTGIVDVNNARSRLTSVCRKVALKKFNWNTDEDYELLPDADRVIVIPAGALEVDPMDASKNVVVRRHPTKNALALWNKDDKTWLFAAPIKCKVTWGFAFEDMPEVARSYIVATAGRKFQANIVGSLILDRFEEKDETEAWVELQRTELRSRDNNLFRSNPSMSRFLSRRY